MKENEQMPQILRLCFPALVLLTALSLIISLSYLIFPIYMIQVFDRVIASASMGTLTALTLIAVVGLLLSAIFEALRSRTKMVVGHWMSKRLNEDAIRLNVQAAVRGHGNAGQTLRDINDLRIFVSGGSVVAALEAIWSPLFLVVLFLLHPWFGWYALIAGIILVGLGIGNELVTSSSIQRASHASVEAFNEMGTALRNAEVVDAMGMTRSLARRWQEAYGNSLSSLAQSTSLLDVVMSFSKSLRMIAQVGIMAIAVILILDNEITGGTLIAVMVLFGRSTAPFEQLIDGWRQWAMALAAYQRVEKAFEVGVDDRSTLQLPPSGGNLEMERVVYLPPRAQKPIIRGISLRFSPGEFTVITGPSAAGKSTLAKLLVGIIQANSGRVIYGGHEMYQWNRESIGPHIGYLPQTVDLFEATVAENIARLGDRSIDDVVEAAKAAGVHAMIGSLPFGYETEIGVRKHPLTGGQRQRIGLARALFGLPKMVILDEPDANLDVEGEEALIESLSAIKERGAIVVAISHRTRLLSIADRIVTVHEGVITDVKEGTRLIEGSSYANAGGDTP